MILQCELSTDLSCWPCAVEPMTASKKGGWDELLCTQSQWWTLEGPSGWRYPHDLICACSVKSMQHAPPCHQSCFLKYLTSWPLYSSLLMNLCRSVLRPFSFPLNQGIRCAAHESAHGRGSPHHHFRATCAQECNDTGQLLLAEPCASLNQGFFPAPLSMKPGTCVVRDAVRRRSTFQESELSAYIFQASPEKQNQLDVHLKKDLFFQSHYWW
jgi:hypothetical protein